MAALCEANYLRLQKLLAVALPASGSTSPAPGDCGCVELPDCAAALFLNLCDVAPFTVTLELNIQPLELGVAEKSLDFPTSKLGMLVYSRPMRIRVYHDLKMAEVIDYAQQGVGKSRYDYPNAQMLASDERWQQNLLLSEWLSRALEQGLPTAGSVNEMISVLSAS